MQKKCSTCTHSMIARHKPITGRPCDACAHLEKWEPMTNADAIRAMRDEELAKLLLEACRGSKCGEQPLNEYGSIDCFRCRLTWLQQPKEMAHHLESYVDLEEQAKKNNAVMNRVIDFIMEG